MFSILRNARKFGSRLLEGVGRKRRQPSIEDVFTEIFEENKWGGVDSVSGPGSDLHQTRIIMAALPQLLDQYSIRTMLDVPCGDFHWMRHVPKSRVHYIGADIVAELIDANAREHGSAGVEFRKLDLLGDSLPKVDLVLCRDGLVHFSDADVLRALLNLCDSGSTYLLMTTFVRRALNLPIATGQWRPLNLESPPFLLPAPLAVIEEGCPADDGAFSDKSLALWRLADLPAVLERCARAHLSSRAP